MERDQLTGGFVEFGVQRINDPAIINYGYAMVRNERDARAIVRRDPQHWALVTRVVPPWQTVDTTEEDD